MNQFKAVLLDEASILKDFTGKFCQLLIDSCKCVPFRYCFSATPSPNDYTELGNYAEFLGICTRTEMLAEYFVHDGETTQEWRLKGHAEEVFWKWLCSWAVALNNPRDMGFDGTDYDLPELRIHEHIIECDEEVNLAPGVQQSLWADLASTLTEQRIIKKSTVDLRCEKARDIMVSSKRGGVVWAETNEESEKIVNLLDCIEITGSMKDDVKQERLVQFIKSDSLILDTKASIAGHGLNMQKYNLMVFVNLTHSAERMYQAFARMHRFGQKKPVDVHLILSAGEMKILQNYKRKVADMEKMIAKMIEHMSIYHDVAASKQSRVEYKPEKKIQIPSFLEKQNGKSKNTRRKVTVRDKAQSEYVGG